MNESKPKTFMGVELPEGLTSHDILKDSVYGPLLANPDISRESAVNVVIEARDHWLKMHSWQEGKQ